MKLITLIVVMGLVLPAWSQASEDTLRVTNVTAVKPYAQASNTFESGWKWVFDVTLPINESKIQMKFGDLTNGTNTIPAVGNIRFSSDQAEMATDGYKKFNLIQNNDYSEVMNIRVTSDISDLSTSTPGRQIQILVEAKVPTGTIGSSYSMSYDIQSLVDPARPIIELLGANPLELSYKIGHFDDPGYRIVDINGNVTPLSLSIYCDNEWGGANMDIVGSYYYTYSSCSDTACAVPVIRTVNVVDKSKTTITLLGANPQVIELGGNYSELGMTGWNSMHWLQSTSTDASAVKTDAVGTYEVVYTAINLSGKATTTARTVNIVDTTKPLISLIGSNPQNLYRGGSYIELGANITDLATTTLSVATSTLDLNTNGSYGIVYTATDASGNSASTTRTVNVIDPVNNI